jgi:hypothetical protein
MAEPDFPDDLPSLSISPEKVCYIATRAREFEVMAPEDDTEAGASQTEERFVRALAEEDHDRDPVQEELTELINDMSEDEQIDLVALAWLGRGDGSIGDWPDLRQQASDAHNERTATYLLGIPLLPDYLEDGLSAFGHSCEDSDAERY